MNYTKYEIEKCVNDVNYFATNYVKVVEPNKGLITLEDLPQRQNIFKSINENQIARIYDDRQSHKTTSVCAYLLHQALFTRKQIAIIGQKVTVGKEILRKIKHMYENLPEQLKEAVTEYNKTSISFAHGSRIFVASGACSLRGYSLDILYLDEFELLHQETQIEIRESIFPCILSAKNSKIIITSY